MLSIKYIYAGPHRKFYKVRVLEMNMEKPLHPFFPRTNLPNPEFGKPQYTEFRHTQSKGIPYWMIETSVGCLRNCEWCVAPHAPNLEDVEVFPIPELKENLIYIKDMNFLWQPNIIERIRELGSRKWKNKVIEYRVISGFDYKLCTKEIIHELKEARFRYIHLAWDGSFDEQCDIRKVIDEFMRVGYRSREMSVYVLTNHKISYKDCCRKLDLLKVWRVKICDSYFNGGIRIAKPIHWTQEEMTKFRAKCAVHNRLVAFGIDQKHEVNRRIQAGEISDVEVRRRHLKLKR